MKIISPLFIRKGIKKPKNYYLNLNSYRNRHYLVSNDLKIRYKKIMTDRLNGLSLKTPISITYYLYTGTQRKCDIANVLTIVDKFFCDTLVELGIIEDDNYDFVKEINFKYGGYDKGNGRVEIEINSV